MFQIIQTQDWKTKNTNVEKKAYMESCKTEVKILIYPGLASLGFELCSPGLREELWSF